MVDNEKRRREFPDAGLVAAAFQRNYALIAFTGQVSTQAPQSIQVSASIARFSPASLIAFTGQESSHAPQLMHSSEMV
jgi:hypothetical protein